MTNKNKNSWNQGAAAYSAFSHSEKMMRPILENPANAFHNTVWRVMNEYISSFEGLKVCVPSSGDNYAVFAFAMLGAQVTSCDISENQIANAQRVAKLYGWDASIEFVCADTMRLDAVADGAYDFVYTSNGVHVWINDLPAMYRNIHRVLKPGGTYMMYEIHPFMRPFDDDLKVIKPYDATGPFETNEEVTFGWRVMDIMNAILHSGLNVKHIEEMFAEKDYNSPFWLGLADLLSGVTATREEVDGMHDWHNNPAAALPNWISVVAQK